MKINISSPTFMLINDMKYKIEIPWKYYQIQCKIYFSHFLNYRTNLKNETIIWNNSIEILTSTELFYKFYFQNNYRYSCLTTSCTFTCNTFRLFKYSFDISYDISYISSLELENITIPTFIKNCIKEPRFKCVVECRLNLGK